MAEKMKDDKITDQATYINRRTFMRVAALAGTATATTLLYRRLNPPPPVPIEGEKLNDVAKTTDANGFNTTEQLTAIRSEERRVGREGGRREKTAYEITR